MRETGVAHIFCSFVQFGILFKSVLLTHMNIMPYPMIYVNNAEKVKKRTLSKCPQNNSKCAAIFWRNVESRKKPYFSVAESYPQSYTTAWTNTVTNISPMKERLGSKQVCHQYYELCKSILKQWCKPGGLVYSPLADSFSFVLACFDLGLTYFGLQQDREVFDVSISNLIDEQNRRSKRRKIVDANEETSSFTEYYSV